MNQNIKEPENNNQSLNEKILDLAVKANSNSIIALAVSIIGLAAVIGCLLR